MSSDGYFDDSEHINSAFLAELDAIEGAHLIATQPPSQTKLATASPKSSKSALQTSSLGSLKSSGQSSYKHANPQPVPIDVDADESYDQFFDDIDPLELDRIEKDGEKSYISASSVERSNRASGSGVTRQLTLFGSPLPQAPSRVPRATQQKSQTNLPSSPRKTFGKKSRKVKKWNHTAFAKSGGKSNKGKANSKAKAIDCDEEADGAMCSTEEFEQFPAPSMFLQSRLYI